MHPVIETRLNNLAVRLAMRLIRWVHGDDYKLVHREDHHPGDTLFVFNSMGQMLRNGFVDAGRHRFRPDYLAWCPSQSKQRLRSRPIRTVIVDSYADVDEEARQLLRSRQLTFGKHALWIEI